MNLLKTALANKPEPHYVKNFLSLTERYSVFLFDIWGVVHDGIHAFPGVVETINALALKQKVIFLSNMPRPRQIAREKLNRLGIHNTFDIVTSGDVTRDLLTTTYQGQKIYHLGAHCNKDIGAGLDLNLVENVEEADLVLLTAFMEPDEDEHQYDVLIAKISQKKIPVLCANPDKIAMNGKEIRRCAGMLAEKIEQQGGNVLSMGKPDPIIYQAVMKRFPEFGSHQMLMIGDTLETDIIGATQVGIDSFLILTGNTGNELRDQGFALVDFLHVKGREIYCPTYYGDSFV